MLQLEFVRTHLISALLNVSIPRDQPEESRIFSDMRNQSYQSKPMREIAFEDRTIRIEATPMYCSETRPYKGGKLLISPEAYRLASWRRVVSALPPFYESWIRYCYGDSTNFKHQIALCHHAWSVFSVYQTEIGAPAMSKKVKDTVQKLVWLCVQESKKMINRGIGDYSAKDLAKLCDVTESNWSRVYQPRWKALLQVVTALDKEALIHAEQEHRADAHIRRSTSMPV